jgi:hypothetical protein
MKIQTAAVATNGDDTEALIIELLVVAPGPDTEKPEFTARHETCRDASFELQTS